MDEIVFNAKALDGNVDNREEVVQLTQDFLNHLGLCDNDFVVKRFSNCVTLSEREYDNYKFMIVFMTKKLRPEAVATVIDAIIEKLDEKHIKFVVQELKDEYLELFDLYTDENIKLVHEKRQELVTDIIQKECIGYIYLPQSTREKIINNEYVVPTQEEIMDALVEAYLNIVTSRERTIGLNCVTEIPADAKSIKEMQKSASAKLTNSDNCKYVKIEEKLKEYDKLRDEDFIPSFRYGKMIKEKDETQKSLDDFDLLV